MKNATSTKKAKAGTKASAKKVKAGTGTAARKPAKAVKTKAGSAGKPATYVDGKSLVWYMKSMESTEGKKKPSTGKKGAESLTREEQVFRLCMARFLRIMREQAGDIDKGRCEEFEATMSNGYLDQETLFNRCQVFINKEVSRELAGIKEELATIKELLTTPRPLTVLSNRNLKVKLPWFDLNAGDKVADKERKHR